MTNDNPFFMNFNVSDFMGKFAIPGMDNEYSKKLMSIHKDNLDAFVTANKIVSDGYQKIATRQMEIFQDSLIKMSKATPADAAELSQAIFDDSTQQMQELIELATKAHQEAYSLLASRTKDMVEECKVKA